LTVLAAFASAASHQIGFERELQTKLALHHQVNLLASDNRCTQSPTSRPTFNDSFATPTSLDRAVDFRE
jgi:hypothetical protein